MPKISACIVAYCDYDEVCAAVRSVLANTPGDDFALYVVDNASPDGCGPRLAQTDFGDARVQVICLPKNRRGGNSTSVIWPKAKLPPFVRGLLCIGTVLLVCFVVSIVLEVWYCKSAPNAAIKLAACLVLDAFAFLLPGVVATITAMHVIRKDKNKFRKQVRKPMPKR